MNIGKSVKSVYVRNVNITFNVWLDTRGCRALRAILDWTELDLDFRI